MLMLSLIDEVLPLYKLYLFGFLYCVRFILGFFRVLKVQIGIEYGTVLTSKSGCVQLAHKNLTLSYIKKTISRVFLRLKVIRKKRSVMVLWPVSMGPSMPFEHLIKTFERVERLELVANRILV
jgi:hypothetical protein